MSKGSVTAKVIGVENTANTKKFDPEYWQKFVRSDLIPCLVSLPRKAIKAMEYSDGDEKLAD